jgi:hypothetical protein
MEKNCVLKDFFAEAGKRTTSSPRNLIDFGLRVALSERSRVYRLNEEPVYLVQSKAMKRVLQDIISALENVTDKELPIFRQSALKLQESLADVFELLGNCDKSLSEEESDFVFSRLREVRENLKFW